MLPSEKTGGNLNSLAVVRAQGIVQVKTTILDFIRYGRLSFVDKPRKLEPVIADKILINVLKSPLRMNCEAAAIVPLENEASAAIGLLRKIHPPAHVIIVSPRHDIYDRLVKYVDILPVFDMTMEINTGLQEVHENVHQVKSNNHDVQQHS